MFVEWKESYAVGIDEVDRQHRELFARFETLMNAIGAGKGKEELLSLLGFLDDYVIAHFRDEEELHRTHHYPDAGFHREAHAVLQRKLATLRGEIETSGISNLMVIQTGRTLFNWLVDHVCGRDRHFGEFLRGGGAERIEALAGAGAEIEL
ncbi:bacteriohemerythrin [Geobacter pickeringii]|uniref:bacteriohemerythrin n=1 Tax=Geobacter pickeringii TaxID=345632 RepID=UPI00068F6A19|nr:hemerythrin family protein [Geobacter pickeringii]